MDCCGTYTLHMSKPNVTRVQSATEWTASVHTAAKTPVGCSQKKFGAVAVPSNPKEHDNEPTKTKVMYQKDLLHICHSLRRETIETKYDDNEIDNFFWYLKNRTNLQTTLQGLS